LERLANIVKNENTNNKITTKININRSCSLWWNTTTSRKRTYY